MNKDIEEAMSHMTQEQLLASVPYMLDEILNMAPISERAKMNVVISKLKKAVVEQDEAAVLELQKQFGASKDPLKRQQHGPIDVFFNLFKRKK
jgi:hypothetical protein